jgi:DNA-binding transcriptional MocR family regulator
MKKTLLNCNEYNSKMTKTVSRNAKYQKLATMLQRQIELGQLDPGQKLPPVRDIAHQMQVTPGTVARAYRVLIDDGYLEAGVGQGTYVKQLRASVLPSDDAPFYLRSPRLPDVGQVDLIRRRFLEFCEQAGFHDMMAYPTRADTTTLQQAYLNWLKYFPLGRCGPEDVVISHGGQQACVAILQFLVSKRDVNAIAVEHLSYPGFRDMASVANAAVYSVDWDQDGPLPFNFETLIRNHRIGALFTPAEVNNPTTQSTTNARRKKLVDIARRYGVAIIEDDCYRAGPYDRVSYRAIYPKNGWYVTSFFKSILPARRIRCALCPDGPAHDLRQVVFANWLGISSALIYVANYVLRHPKIDEIQDRVRHEVRSYVTETVNRLGQFDVEWQADVPIIWLNLPNGWRTTAFCQASEQAGVLLSAGEQFVTRQTTAPHAVRLYVNSEYGLNRYLDEISTLAALLRNPDRSSGI